MSWKFYHHWQERRRQVLAMAMASARCRPRPRLFGRPWSGGGNVRICKFGLDLLEKVRTSGPNKVGAKAPWESPINLPCPWKRPERNHADKDNILHTGRPGTFLVRGDTKLKNDFFLPNPNNKKCLADVIHKSNSLPPRLFSRRVFKREEMERSQSFKPHSTTSLVYTEGNQLSSGCFHQWSPAAEDDPLQPRPFHSRVGLECEGPEDRHSFVPPQWFFLHSRKHESPSNYLWRNQQVMCYVCCFNYFRA